LLNSLYFKLEPINTKGLVVWLLEHCVSIHKAPRRLDVPIFRSATIDVLNHGDWQRLLLI